MGRKVYDLVGAKLGNCFFGPCWSQEIDLGPLPEHDILIEGARSGPEAVLLRPAPTQ
jgi:hypothetical protein